MRNGGVTTAILSRVVTIRHYRPDDLEDCRSLWVDLTDWHRELYGDRAIGGDDPASGFDAHLAEVGPERIWVAEQGGRAVGMAGMIVHGRKVELEPLSVRAGCRGAGIGRQLAETVIAAARKEGAGQIFVRPTGRNAQAIQVFHTLGFDVISRVELIYDLTDDQRWRESEQVAGRTFRV
jgi:N-acetylglutamate synthase-like GNAT family acetyltransferase